MVSEYITGIKVAWESAKKLKEAVDAFDKAQIKLELAELMSALANAKMEAAENTDKISELEKILNVKDSMEFDGNKYYQIDEDGSKNGPFCPTCYDSDSKLIHLHNRPDDSWGPWACEVCRRSFD